MESAEKIDDLVAGVRIQIARGFIGQDQFGIVDERSGDGYPLLLAAGELAGPVVQAVPQTDASKQLFPPRFGLRGRDSCEAGWQTDVLQGIQLGQEVVGLEDKADFEITESGQLASGERGEVLAGEKDISPGGYVQTSQKVEERALPGAGRPPKGGQFTSRHGEVDAAENLDAPVVKPEGLAQIAGHKKSPGVTGCLHLSEHAHARLN